MNNLKGMHCYSVGPIDRVPDAGKQWRLELNEWLPSLGVTHINPHDKPFKSIRETDEDRAEIVALKKKGRLSEVKERYSDIRTVDLRSVDLSSFIIARIDVEAHLCGSYEELFLANSQKKPVLCHIVQGIEETPSWLLFTLPSYSFFNTMEEIKHYLHLVDGMRSDILDKRWVCFNEI